MRDFADARQRIRDWVAIFGTRLEHDRPTRQTTWPGEATDHSAGEVEIHDRAADFEELVRVGIRRRCRAEAIANEEHGR